MAIFPLKQRPAVSYHERPRAFGSPRDGERKHAGCDLYAPAGTEVLAVEDGVVTRGAYLFYDVVFALEIQHASGVVRYGEISRAAPGIRVGSAVVAGQVIGYVGKMEKVEASMLHFELYRGITHGPLTDKDQPPYMRRSDLIDPTAFLDSCTDSCTVEQ